MGDPLGKKVATDLTRIFFAVLIFGSLLIGSFWVLSPFLSAILWAVMIVIPTWPAMCALTARLGGRRIVAVTIMTASLIMLVVVPIWLALTTIVEQRQTLTSWVTSLDTETLPAAPSWLSGVPVVGAKLAMKWNEISSSEAETLLRKAAPLANQALSWFLSRLEGVGLLFVHFLLTIVIAVILLLRGEVFAEGVRRFAFRVGGERGEAATTLAGRAIKAVAMGVVVTALVQSTLACISFWLVGIPYAVLLAAVVFVLGVIQVGGAPVLIPCVLWLFWKDDTTTAIFFSFCSLIVLSVDNFLRPILIKRGADLPLLLIFSGVIGGLFGFGIIGLFVGPTILAVSYTLLVAWVNERT